MTEKALPLTWFMFLKGQSLSSNLYPSQLYPSYTSLKYNSLLRDVQHFLSSQLQLDDILPYNHQGALFTSPTSRHGTADLHTIVANLEQHYWSRDRQNFPEDVSVQENFGNVTGQHWGGYHDILINNVFEIDPMYKDPRYHRPRCSDGEPNAQSVSACSADGWD